MFREILRLDIRLIQHLDRGKSFFARSHSSVGRNRIDSKTLEHVLFGSNSGRKVGGIVGSSNRFRRPK